MSKRRSSTEILREILKVCPETLIGIRFEVGMNHTQAQRYLPFLVENGYLEPHQAQAGKTVYHLTSKGNGFLRLLSELHDMADSSEGEI